MNQDNQAKKPAKFDLSELTELLASLRQEISRLAERVAALETGKQNDGQQRRQEKQTPVVEPREVELDEEIVAVLAAAIAAFLGKVPRIRQIRLIGTTSWAQQGRVTIQTSHALTASHTRSER